MLDNDQRRERIARVARWGIVLATAIVIAPFIFLAVKGMVGLAFAVGTGLAINALAPVVALRLATWRVSGLKAIARGNPIETREHLGIQNRARLQKQAESITSFSAEVKNFADEVDRLKTKYPEEAKDFQDQLHQCNLLLQHQRMKYEAAVRAADDFDAVTERAKAKWRVSQSAIRMRRLAGQQADETMNKILAEEAVDSVDNAMNQAFAELETSIMEAGTTLKLPHAEPTLLVHEVQHKEGVRK